MGPYFGDNELSAWNEPFNGEGKCLSNSNGPNFAISFEGGKNSLNN